MTDTQKKLASRLLEEAAGEYIKNSHIFNLVEDGNLTKNEEKEISTLIELDNFSDRKQPGESYPAWILMQWLARVLDGGI